MAAVPKRVARKSPVANVLVAECPSRQVLSHLTSRWGALVMLALRNGTLRFGELSRCVGGVSDKMLAHTLRLLEEDGFLVRTVHPEVPPKVEYTLTALGVEAAAHVAGLTHWIERSLPRILRVRDVITQRATKPNVRRMKD